MIGQSFSLLATVNPGKVEEMCPKLTGRIVLPNDPHYDDARIVSNYYSSKNSLPRVIVYAQNTHDVQNAVRWARCHRLPIRIRSGGHNHEGFSTGTDTVVIDVSEMKNVQVDKVKSLATVQPGITGGELYAILFKEGLTQVGGTCKDVGVSGLVLTGGMGPLARLKGLACDNLVSFDMVDANRKVIHATQNNEHKDLFWAACGGGAGNFGIVTSLVIKVYPAKPVTWFNIGWDWNQPIDKVVTAWQDFFLKEDNRWFSHLDLWAKPFSSEKFKKQPVKVLGVFYGTPEVARKELAPLLTIGKPSDQTIELVNWDTAIQLFEDSTSTYLTEKPEYKSTGAFAMAALPPKAINMIVNTLQQSSDPLLNVLFLCLGGAVKDKSPTETAYFYRHAEYLVVYSLQWLQGQDAVKQISHVDAFRQQLLTYTRGDYVGNPDRSLKDYLIAYYGDNVQRLRCVKKKYDPEDVFHFEQSIPPATENQHCGQKI
jgi:FAD/FMN-containing dehydrogenase